MLLFDDLLNASFSAQIEFDDPSRHLLEYFVFSDRHYHHQQLLMFAE
jgi:hypothetical protein